MATLQRQLQLRGIRGVARTYHSYDHPPTPRPFKPFERAILSAALSHVPLHGFTQTSLAHGAKDVGYLDASTNLFPNGAFSLVHYHLIVMRLGLLKHSHIAKSSKNEKPLGVVAKVRSITWERLLSNQEIIQHWQEALALMALPRNISISLHELASLSDEIWFLSGDTSVDTSWYTKRASLSTIYAAADMFMTTDKSEGFTSTKDFLNRRFEDSFMVGTTLRSVGQWVGFTVGAGVNVLRSKGVRI